MRRFMRCLPHAGRLIRRHRGRSILTIAGIAVAMFLFTAVQAMHQGVTAATRTTANDTTLVVYQEDRYCPATSQLPEDYRRRIEQIEGVVSATPIKIAVSNCRASLDVITFRGVPKDDFLSGPGKALTVVDGSIEDWRARTDAVLLGETLSKRRGLTPGMRFDAAGITATVAGVVRSENPQDQNVAYAALEFVQLAGRDGLGVVTQFNVRVADASQLDAIAAAIDERFRTAQRPTVTAPEKAFIGRVAGDIVELVGFARWLGIGCLAAVLALVANSVVLGLQGRVSELAVLGTIGFSGRLLAGLIVFEGLVLAAAGGAVGSIAAIAVARTSHLAFSVEGTTIPIVASGSLIATGLAVCAGIGVLAGLVPAWQAGRRDLAASLRAT